jgi:hypothetical protein
VVLVGMETSASKTDGWAVFQDGAEISPGFGQGGFGKLAKWFFGWW